MLKRTLMVLILLSLSYVLVGCSQDSTKTSEKQSNQPTHQRKTKQNTKTKTAKKQQNNQTDQKNNDQQGKTTIPDSQKSQTEQSNTPTSNQSETVNSNSQNITTVANPTNILVLVNKTHKLSDGYVPKNLVIPHVAFPYSGQYEKMHMRAIAAHALESMFTAAKADAITLYAQSGYRSYNTQKAIFATNVKRYGDTQASRVSAHPGTSEHQTGLAMDITSSDVNDLLIQKFGDTKEGKWVAAHAHEYGFIIRYPMNKEQITGYEYEPWHLRYIGKKPASYIFSHHITLEKYIKLQKS